MIKVITIFLFILGNLLAYTQEDFVGKWNAVDTMIEEQMGNNPNRVTKIVFSGIKEFREDNTGSLSGITVYKTVNEGKEIILGKYIVTMDFTWKVDDKELIKRKKSIEVIVDKEYRDKLLLDNSSIEADKLMYLDAVMEEYYKRQKNIKDDIIKVEGNRIELNGRDSHFILTK